MNQKRFLTADEVFQLFGVDTEMLDQLVEAGDVQALQDLGSFKFRREDFVKLVQDGRLSPRTAGEMFQVDAQGDIPFLKLKQQDDGLKFDEDVEFLELDEDALNEQAGKPTSKTPVRPENRMSDSDETGSMQTSREVSVFDTPEKSSREKTDFEVTSRDRIESDSNVRLISDETIDFDEPRSTSAGTDSDVRLSGPVSSSKSGPISKGESDSDVRFFKMVSESGESDSDVSILPSSAIPPMPKNASKGATPSSQKQPDSDSDVQIAPVAGSPSAGHGTAQKSASPVESDSDIILMGSPADAKSGSSKWRLGKKADSDSDVRLASDSGKLSPDAAAPVASIHADTDSDVKLSDSSVRLEPGSTPSTPVVPAVSLETSTPEPADDPVELSLDFLDNVEEAAIEQDAHSDTAEHPLEMADDDDDSFELSLLESPITEHELPVTSESQNELRLHQADDDSEVSLEETGLDREFTLASSATDSEIAVEPDSGISLEAEPSDSGISLDQSGTDSGISLDPAGSDIKVLSAAQKPASDIVLGGLQDDSNIRFGLDQDSGISLDTQGADSGIMLDQGDSGIRFDSPADSGISLMDADSGISIESGDSGISLGDDSDDLGATFVDRDLPDFEPKSKNAGQTETFESRDSGFDVSLAESDHTMEMTLDEDLSSSETVVQRDKKKSSGSKSLDLSEAFQLDEPLEVEDLDISEDLDAAVGSDFSDEFASIDEDEVVEVSDDAFSADSVSVAEGASDESLEAEVAAAPKRRTGPTEPPWGMAAVAPIIGASLAMAVTVLVLWGGVSTMWDGSEASGPAAMLISTLGGLF
ncbi:midas domain-containing protein [Schlesneria paludicola]|uniref:hypothetical protein n=1 Tax=Schlesneria paludicola TaxID=360056 RepID=UPI00029B04A8|nr:hypothetical protein [Schlesneria paludicola]